MQFSTVSVGFYGFLSFRNSCLPMEWSKQISKVVILFYIVFDLESWSGCRKLVRRDEISAFAEMKKGDIQWEKKR